MKTNTAVDIKVAHQNTIVDQETKDSFIKYIDNVDDYLGDSATRFFGYGYRRVAYDVQDIAISASEISATAAIEYPQDWSVKKKQIKLKPHMSSIDALLLSTHLAGRLLVALSGENETYSLIQISINAGRKPLLDLDAIAVTLSYEEKCLGEGRKIVEFRGAVGNMKVSLKAVKGDAFHNPANSVLLQPDYIHVGFKNAVQRICDLAVYSQTEISARFNKLTDSERLERADYIDAFVASLQLGQVMLYELDGLSRANSNNLWMRSIKMSRNLRPYSAMALHTQLNDLHLFEVNHQTWRSAEIIGRLADIDVACSVAHQLPVQE